MRAEDNDGSFERRGGVVPVCRVSCFLPREGRAAGQDGRDGGIATAERNGRGVGERTAASGRQVKCVVGVGGDGDRIGGVRVSCPFGI